MKSRRMQKVMEDRRVDKAAKIVVFYKDISYSEFITYLKKDYIYTINFKIWKFKPKRINYYS